MLDEVAAAAGAWGVELVSVAVEDLRSGQRWELAGERAMSFMSSSKFPWVAMAVASAGVEAAQEAAVATFLWSDNDAAAELIELAGGLDAVNDVWYPALGMSGTCHQQWYGAWYGGACDPARDGPIDGYGYEFHNRSTASDLTTFLARLWRGEVPGLDAAGRAAVLDWALLSPDVLDLGGDGTLTGYLPPEAHDRAHHKVGWDFEGYLSASDIGIVDVPRATYAISLGAFGGTDSATQQHFLAWASCLVYRELARDGAWRCPGTLEAGLQQVAAASGEVDTEAEEAAAAGGQADGDALPWPDASR